MALPCLRRDQGGGEAGEADAVCFGQEHGLDFQRLLDASAYKEAYRRDMILWSEQRRQADPGFFCRKAVEGVSQPVWVRVWGGGTENTGRRPAFPRVTLRRVRASVSMATSRVQPPPSGPRTIAEAPTLAPASALVSADAFTTWQPE